MENIQDSPYGRTSPERSPAIKEKTSGQSSKPWAELCRTDWQFLDLRNGTTQGGWSVQDGALPGVSMTLNTGECPSVERGSTLSQILEANAHPKYCLSARACQGILNRAKKQGKPLPQMLKEALEETVSLSKSGPVNLGGGKGILPAAGRAFTLSTNVDQSIAYALETICLENHPMDSRVSISKDNIVQTLNARMGTGGVMYQ